MLLVDLCARRVTGGEDAVATDYVQGCVAHHAALSVVFAADGGRQRMRAKAGGNDDRGTRNAFSVAERDGIGFDGTDLGAKTGFYTGYGEGLFNMRAGLRPEIGAVTVA